MEATYILFLTIIIVVTVSCKKDDVEREVINSDVSQEVEYKTALLEEFTGVRCKFCPDGAEIAKNMQAAHPGKVAVVAIHGGSYAEPYDGDPDLRTPWANELISFSGLTGYPNGMVQRRNPNNSSKFAMNRDSWKNVANIVVEELAPVNIGLKTAYNEVNDTVNIRIELYYTANAAGDNLLNVAVCENNIVTAQAGDPTPDDQYIQNHVLRDLLTGQWGLPVTKTNAGAYHIFEFTYKMKEGEEAANCEIVAFVTQANKAEVLNADICSLIDGEVN